MPNDKSHTNILIVIAIIISFVAFLTGKEIGYKDGVKFVCIEADYKTEYCQEFRLNGMVHEYYGNSDYEPKSN